MRTFSHGWSTPFAETGTGRSGFRPFPLKDLLQVHSDEEVHEGPFEVHLPERVGDDQRDWWGEWGFVGSSRGVNG